MRKLLMAAILCLPAIAAADGKATYDKMCASCHGADGKGNESKAKMLKIDAAVLNLGRPESAKQSRDELKTLLLSGKGKMPAYEKKLQPADVDPVLDYAIELAKAIRGK
jgi:mono/diheme cytochrome c family protein